MNMKNALLVLLVFELSFAALSVSDWSVSQETFRPGANGVIQVDIANPCTSAAGVMSCAGIETVSSVDVRITSPPELVMSGQQFVGDIEAGGSTKISLPFKVSETATSSIYTVQLRLSGISDAPEGGYEVFYRTVSIPVTIVNEPSLGLSTDSEVISGIDTVKLTVSNNGGPASNVKLKVSESSPVAFYGVDQLYVGRVSSAAPAISDIILDSRSADDGAIDVPFELEYEDELGIKHTIDTKLRMTVRKEKLDLTFTQLSEVITRKDGTLTLQVRNDGPDALKDVRLSFQDSAIRLKDQSELKFGDLQPGATVTVSAAVFADKTPGTNLVDSQISWIEKDLQREEFRSVPLTITSDADVAVFLEARPAPLTVGTEHTISVLVSNLGSYAIENVDVTMSSPAMQSLDIADTQYIGGLQSDDFSTVQFLMKVNATSEGSYPIDIKINYRDQSGEWKQKTIVQRVTAYAPVAPPDNSILLIIVLGVIAVAVWYFKFRKK